jgi:hypothetical protein
MMKIEIMFVIVKTVAEPDYFDAAPSHMLGAIIDMGALNRPLNANLPSVT